MNIPLIFSALGFLILYLIGAIIVLKHYEKQDLIENVQLREDILELTKENLKLIEALKEKNYGK